MEMERMIQEWCGELNEKIHQDIYLDNFLLPDESRHSKAFTSLDVIEDSQSAIDEFINLPDTLFLGRSTLYIYGVLQALYCQQDGLQHFFEALENRTFNGFHGLIKHLGSWNEINTIRSVRNEIAGHPSNLKNGKEFYFIAKGQNSKFRFEYGGYTPKFKSAKIDLKDFIEKQHKFCRYMLELSEKTIDDQVMSHKSKFHLEKLTNKVDNLSYAKQQIFKAIYGTHPLAEMGYSEIARAINEVTAALNARYNNSIPSSLSDTLRLINHILAKVHHWIVSDALYKNTDAEIFMDSLSKQLDELEAMLKEVDETFSVTATNDNC